MLKKIIVGLALTLCLLLCSCTLTEPDPTVQPNFNGSKIQKDQYEPGEENFPIEENDQKNYIKKVNIVEGKNPVSFKYIDYANINIQKSKKLLYGIQKKDINFYNDSTHAMVDDDGTILNDNTYIFITADIKNKQETNVSICLSTGIVTLDEEFAFPVCTLTSVYRSGKEFNNQENYFFEDFKPQETMQVTMACIVPDDLVNNENLYFLFFPTSKEEDIKANEPIEDDKVYKIN